MSWPLISVFSPCACGARPQWWSRCTCGIHEIGRWQYVRDIDGVGKIIIAECRCRDEEPS